MRNENLVAQETARPSTIAEIEDIFDDEIGDVSAKCGHMHERNRDVMHDGSGRRSGVVNDDMNEQWTFCSRGRERQLALGRP